MKLSLLALGLFFSINAKAAIGPAQDYTIQQQYLSPRAVGMGNAFVAVADDAYAIFYNPAGLAWFDSGEMNFGIGAMGDKDIPSFYSDMKKATKDKDQQKMADLLTKYSGEHLSARAPTVGWMWARPKWAVAIIPADTTLEVGITNAGLGTANIVGTNDTTIAYGRGWNIPAGRGKLAIGATARAVYRLYANKVVTVQDLVNNSDIFNKADAKEGFGADLDLGVMYATPKDGTGFFKKWFRPTVGATVRNVVDAGFANNFHWVGNQTGRPERARRRFDVGAKFDLPDWWIWKTRFAIDERDIGHDNWTWGKGFHAGAEFLWKVAGWWKGGWRIGINQQYPTFGFTAKLGCFQLDLATYGEQVESSRNPQQSRRYMAKASLDF